MNEDRSQQTTHHRAAENEPGDSDPDNNKPIDVVRVGSPFRGEPFGPATSMQGESANRSLATGPQAFSPEDIYFQASPLRYTAMGSVAASAMVVLFAATAAVWFPIGTAMTAGLGCLLSVFGLYSPHRLLASGLLVVHLMLFLYSYSQTM
ncbi:hypothetical protein [Planctomycetes bacterium CA13]|uniref:hypothetical protein n=1 Tax=Novipirellula herctigrandis TaxID=2527986 RepID=UPI0011B460B0